MNSLARCRISNFLFIGCFISLAPIFLDAATPVVQFPGVNPGPMSLTVANHRILVRNQALEASWALSSGGLKLDTIRSGYGGRAIQYTGEVFRIVFTNGRTVSASSLRMQHPPVISGPGEASTNRLSSARAGKQAALLLRSEDGRVSVWWRVVALDGANYIRQALEVLPETSDVIREIQWFDQTIAGAQMTGSVDGSPVVAGSLFLACEDPHALNEAVAIGGEHSSNTSGTFDGPTRRVFCRLPRNAAVPKGETLTQTFVIGAAPEGQLRRAFLYYLERERAHPYRPYLHYNSWYDTAWDPFALNQTNCLEAIQSIGEHLVKARGVKLDGLVFDDGWDDPRTLWEFHSGFPDGFAPLARLCESYDTRLGVWLSPFGGYGDSREKRLKFGREQGYETNAAGFSLAGPKYYAAFKTACVRMIRKYGVNHFKFDGIAAGMSARGGAEYVLDTEAMRRVMLELRAEDPDIFINLTTGSWPSPFWLRFADSVWRQGGDMGLAGVGPRQQQWITYRDQETYRNIVVRGPLYPLNSLMSQGVAYSRHGSAGDPTFNSAGFKDDVRGFFGSGTGLQELYIQPGRLTPDDWDVLAEAAKWSRAHADILVDTHWIGGDPGRLEPYGYASWSPRKGVLMLRNPADRPQAYSLDVQTAFELPPGAPQKYTLRSAWAEERDERWREAKAGAPVSIALAPFQILVLEATAEP